MRPGHIPKMPLFQFPINRFYRQFHLSITMFYSELSKRVTLQSALQTAAQAELAKTGVSASPPALGSHDALRASDAERAEAKGSRPRYT
jgi:hypothetical protein